MDFSISAAKYGVQFGGGPGGAGAGIGGLGGGGVPLLPLPASSNDSPDGSPDRGARTGRTYEDNDVEGGMSPRGVGGGGGGAPGRNEKGNTTAIPSSVIAQI